MFRSIPSRRRSISSRYTTVWGKAVTAPILLDALVHERIRELEVRADHARLVVEARALVRRRSARDSYRRYGEVKSRPNLTASSRHLLADIRIATGIELSETVTPGPLVGAGFA